MADNKFDVDAAQKLVNDISMQLAQLPQDSERHRVLRSELAELQAMLARADAHPELEEKFRSVHGTLDEASTELQADGIRVSLFVSELGRILGLD
jgi:hypothetical protein